MFSKYKFENYDFNQIKNKIISFSYTSLENEPSMIHSHRYIEIIIPINEVGIIVGANNKLICKKDHIYIVPKDISHTEKNISDNMSFSYYTLKIKNNIEINKTNIMPLKIEPKIMSYILQRLKTAYEQAQDNLVTSQTLYLDVYIVYQLLINCLNENGCKITDSDIVHYSSFILEVMNYLNNNYKNYINIDQLALTFGLSRSSLEKKFKTDTGITPKQYLINIRLDNAKYLLQYSNYSINQISSLCGFSTSAYFIYLFRQKNQMTPREYRKINN